MINRINKFELPTNCVGCGFCAGVCPQHLIRMEADKYGFYRPKFTQMDSCKDCKLCLQVCPTYNNLRNSRAHLAEIYVGYSINDQVRMAGASGGVVTQFLINLFEANEIDCAVVVRLTYNNRKVRTVAYLLQDPSELLVCASSKYLPVEFSEIVSQLIRFPNRVAFVGLPCHIKALRLTMNKIKQLHDSIRYTVALFCGHCPSFFLIDYFKKRVPKAYGNIINVTFRKKKQEGSNLPCIFFVCKNGEIEFDWNESEFQKLFVDYYFSGKHCMICDDFAGRFADISVGDARLPKFSKEPKGTSIILVRNLDARKYLSNIHLESVTYDDYYTSQKGAIDYRNQAIDERVMKYNLIAKLSFIWYRSGLHWLISPKWLSRFMKIIKGIGI